MMKLRQGRKLKPSDSGQQELLDAIWWANGGLLKTAKLTKIPKYQLNIWRKRGKVPLRYVRNLSKILDVPMAAFNYLELHEILGPQVGTWPGVVRSCRLRKDRIEKVLKANWPSINN